MAHQDFALAGAHLNRTYTFARPCVLRLAPAWVDASMASDGMQLTIDGKPSFLQLGTHRIVLQECGPGVSVEMGTGVEQDGDGAGFVDDAVAVGFGSGAKHEYHVLELKVIPSRLASCLSTVICMCFLLSAFLYVWWALHSPDVGAGETPPEIPAAPMPGRIASLE